MGVYAAMSGAGAAIGLIAGGLLTDYASWRWVLFVNVPIGLICALAAPRALVESERQRGRFDLPGALSATAGFMLLVYGLTHAAPTQRTVNGRPVSVSHWGDPATIATLVLSAALLVTFVLIETRSRHALMPLRIFRNLSRSGAYLVSLCIGTAMFGMFFFLTIFVQRIWLYSPLKTGIAYLPFSIVIVIAAGAASQLVAKTGVRALMVPGALLNVIGMFWMAQLDVNGSYAANLLPPMIVTAAGLGLLFVPLTLASVAGVDDEEAGLASGLLNTGQQVGGSIGLAVLGTVVFTSVADYAGTAFGKASATLGSGASSAKVGQLTSALSLRHGIALGFEVAAGIGLLALIVVLLTIRVRKEELPEASPAAAAA
jgi:predicted MFS family arabinose efflux permease